MSGAMRRIGEYLGLLEDTGYDEYDDEVVKLVVSRCTESESGGRMIDAILTNTMLPEISREFLGRMIEGKTVAAARVGVEGNAFSYAFD